LIGVKSQEVERKVLAILSIINESQKPIGSRVISQRLSDRGFDLSERAIRYHLLITDSRGLTRLTGIDGRTVTEKGIEEISNALVQDKVGLSMARIEMRALQTTFDWKTMTGLVPINVSLFPREKFYMALSAMAPAFKAGICTGNRVVVAEEGGRMGDTAIPRGKIGFGTVCSILLNGVLLKYGIPMESRFGGIVQICNRKPLRFVELIHYNGSSLDPSEIFIRGKMTSVYGVCRRGNGHMLANFREVPSVCLPIVEDTVKGLREAGFNMVLAMGHTSVPVCEVAVEPNKIGIILIGGMNPIAAAEEAGISAENKPMSTVVDYGEFTLFDSLLKQ
jgi:repressor of nif and glnA expression